MKSAYILDFAFLIAIFIGLACIVRAESAPCQLPNCPAGQPHSDLFPVGGSQTIQELSTLTPKVKATHNASYRLLTMSGCMTGSVPDDLVMMADDLRANTGANLIRDDSVFDFTLRINCGNEQIRICGSINIFCLGRGYPYNNDVEISDIISTYPLLSRVSILCHEICGHALAGANEQYCTGTEASGPCQGLSQFTPSPNFVSIMNTGPNSRHLFGEWERGFWARTMWAQSAPEWCCDTVYPGWEGMGVSRYHSPSDSWFWGVPQRNGSEFLYRWRNSAEGWLCISGCPR